MMSPKHSGLQKYEKTMTIPNVLLFFYCFAHIYNICAPSSVVVAKM